MEISAADALVRVLFLGFTIMKLIWMRNDVMMYVTRYYGIVVRSGSGLLRFWVTLQLIYDGDCFVTYTQEFTRSYTHTHTFSSFMGGW